MIPLHAYTGGESYEDDTGAFAYDQSGGEGFEKYGVHSTPGAIADGKLGTFSIWFRKRTAFADDVRLFSIENNVLNSGYFVNLGNGVLPAMVLPNSSGQAIVENELSGNFTVFPDTSFEVFDTTRFHNFSASWDIGNELFQFYVNGVDRTPLLSWLRNDDIDYTKDDYLICTTRTGLGVPVNESTADVDVSRIYFNAQEMMDLDDPAVLARIITPDGLPAKLDSEDGSHYTGSQPEVWLPEGDGSNNKGSMADYVNQGSPVSVEGTGLRIG